MRDLIYQEQCNHTFIICHLVSRFNLCDFGDLDIQQESFTLYINLLKSQMISHLSHSSHYYFMVFIISHCVHDSCKVQYIIDSVYTNLIIINVKIVKKIPTAKEFDYIYHHYLWKYVPDWRLWGSSFQCVGENATIYVYRYNIVLFASRTLKKTEQQDKDVF